jgi:hypothetical protein
LVSILPTCIRQLALLGELEEVRVLFAVAADPDVALVVDVDAVVPLGHSYPRRGRPTSARGCRGIEDEHRRRGRAALADLHLERALVRIEMVVAGVHDPHVILVVDPHADTAADDPMVGQRLGPERIDLEARRLDRAILRVRPGPAAAPVRAEAREER